MKKLTVIYETLLNHYGPQYWWPTDTNLEMIISAILVQNTNWTNVEKSITNLKPYLSNQQISTLPLSDLQLLINPSGFMVRKAQCIKDVIELIEHHPKPTRNQFLAIKGIGEETADCILLYAYDQPYFVIDKYLKRLFIYCGLGEFRTYQDYQHYMTKHIPNDVSLYKEFHALIVAYGKDKKDPLKNLYYHYDKNELDYLKERMPTLNFDDIKRPTYANPLDALIEAIIGQVISTTQAKSIVNEFHSLFPNPFDSITHDLKHLGLSQPKRDTIRRVLLEVQNKTLDLASLHEKSDDEIYRQLTSIKGIGPWTAKIVLIHGYYRENISIIEDLVIRKSLIKHFPVEDFMSVMNRFTPYQSLATIILWKNA